MIWISPMPFTVLFFSAPWYCLWTLCEHPIIILISCDMLKNITSHWMHFFFSAPWLSLAYYILYTRTLCDPYRYCYLHWKNSLKTKNERVQLELFTKIRVKWLNERSKDFFWLVWAPEEMLFCGLVFFFLFFSACCCHIMLLFVHVFLAARSVDFRWCFWGWKVCRIYRILWQKGYWRWQQHCWKWVGVWLCLRVR